MSTVTQKSRFRLWQAREGKARMFRAAAVMERESVSSHIVAKGPGYVVKLIYIPRGTSPEYRTDCQADILCLNLHEFGITEAVNWVRTAVANTPNVAPCIVALGSLDKLSREELWRISEELEPAGAIFHTWPKNCRSFNDAFDSLAEEISKSYGSLNLGTAAPTLDRA